jgi:hypothetical protein
VSTLVLTTSVTSAPQEGSVDVDNRLLIKGVPVLIKQYAMNIYRGIEVQLCYR